MRPNHWLATTADINRKNAMTMEIPVSHTNDPPGCKLEKIRSIAESCDQEYYMSAIAPPHGALERATRGRKRIMNGLVELEALLTSVTYNACRYEIERQIALQTQGIQEIDAVWHSEA